jgi:hypothetical protein
MKTEHVFVKPQFDDRATDFGKVHNKQLFSGWVASPIIPEIGIIEYCGDCGVTQNGTVYYNRKAERKYDTDWYFIPSKKTFEKDYIKIGGTCLDIGSLWSKNYGHWIMDSLGRLSVCDRFMPDLIDKVDYIYTDFPNYYDVCEIIKKLPFASKIIKVENASQCLSFDTVYRPSLPSSFARWQNYTTDYLKKLLDTDSAYGDDKIFILRKSRFRNIKNIEQVLDVVKRLGYKIIDVGVNGNMIDVFKKAKTVISPHQALLVNVMFCKKNTKVLELLPSEHCPAWYSLISNLSGLDYECLICESELDRKTWPKLWSGAKCSVDIDLFCKILESYE